MLFVMLNVMLGMTRTCMLKLVMTHGEFCPSLSIIDSNIVLVSLYVEGDQGWIA